MIRKAFFFGILVLALMSHAEAARKKKKIEGDVIKEPTSAERRQLEERDRVSRNAKKAEEQKRFDDPNQPLIIRKTIRHPEAAKLETDFD